MVSTRNHPTAFPSPDLTSPSKRASTPSTAVARRSKSAQWTHTPSNLTLLWLAISLPLVIWDTGYVFLRPHSMPGGKLHWPIWQPYALYGTIDYVYGWPAYNSQNGFTAAQASLNAVETIFYFVYLWLVLRNGTQAGAKGRGAPSRAFVGWFAQSREVAGNAAGKAVLVGFTAAVMTVSKTVLYWLNEYFGGFENIGHNDFTSLLCLWIIPNGAWIIVPSYMIYVFGQEIVEGLNVAAGVASKKLV
ncbi:uncharacterized protein K452DRAFT_254062 [Aplosporella prunicola CBS 121167]|uniref:EXPERA domain-containing protein n=1 Tax=Aplosporella prunicola CBS 121167 TaxID=1176127 RepID=A0A6A6B7N0_9PEZI|nr:uncharacterized protein K452DRAFT_254062 [Aplosporella prunicola CBS 121167]KAF2139578.1 hypothetical protein K452DRAFT_254062 [Aplosporella prunicola CBS 121167]